MSWLLLKIRDYITADDRFFQILVDKFIWGEEKPYKNRGNPEYFFLPASILFIIEIILLLTNSALMPYICY